MNHMMIRPFLRRPVQTALGRAGTGHGPWLSRGKGIAADIVLLPGRRYQASDAHHYQLGQRRLFGWLQRRYIPSGVESGICVCLHAVTTYQSPLADSGPVPGSSIIKHQASSSATGPASGFTLSGPALSG